MLPCLIAILVIALVCGFRLLQPTLAPWGLDLLERMELASYDWRARLAVGHPGPVATNLAAVYIDEDSIEQLSGEMLGGYQWPFPRSVYGRVVRELRAQGATAVGFDLFFWEPERDYAENRIDGLGSDAFFARELAASGNVVLGTSAADITDGEVSLKPVLPLLGTNAWAVGQDGLRGLGSANRGAFRRAAAFVEDPGSGEKVWHLGLLLAARALGIDLDQARIEPGWIRLRTSDGSERAIPVDAGQGFYLDWTIELPGPDNTQPVQHEPFAALMAASLAREAGQPFDPFLADRLVLIGFAAQGQHADDWGSTAIGPQTPLFLSHLCAANSLLTGRFIQRTDLRLELLLIALLGSMGALLGWRLRVFWSATSAILVTGSYLALATWAYVAHRYWLPVAAPLAGAVTMNYICLFSFRMVVERREARRVRHAFGRLVSPNVFDLLTRDPAAAMSSTQRQVSVFFSDVRGFTRFVEESHARTKDHARMGELRSGEVPEFMEHAAREMLETINLYLGRAADLVKAHDGTLDKYIGDCVMAFWGAPTPARDHAAASVRAAIAIHRAIHDLNRQRQARNASRDRPDTGASGDGTSTPILQMGSTINSGIATAGFMGSKSHISNYTVIGREVNIASRLQDHCGPGQILVTEATRQLVMQTDPALAATFQDLGRVNLSDIPEPVQVHEVPWRDQARGPEPPANQRPTAH
jgi:adenylate cyclase